MNIYKIVDNGWGGIGEQETVIALVKGNTKQDAYNQFLNETNEPEYIDNYTIRKLYKDERDLVNFVSTCKNIKFL